MAFRAFFSVLGGSLPARDLGAYIETTAPFAVALSCSVPSALVGALHSIEVAHAHGVPVVVGGRAFGADPTRSLRVGADAWAADANAAFGIITGWPDAGPVLATPAVPVPAEVDLLRRDRPLVVAGAIAEVAERAVDDELIRQPARLRARAAVGAAAAPSLGRIALPGISDAESAVNEDFKITAGLFKDFADFRELRLTRIQHSGRMSP